MTHHGDIDDAERRAQPAFAPRAAAAVRRFSGRRRQSVRNAGRCRRYAAPLRCCSCAPSHYAILFPRRRTML